MASPPIQTEYIVGLISSIREKANKFIMQELKARNLPGFAPSHGGIWFALFQKGELSMQELARLIARDKSTVTVLIDKLVSFGYVEKSKSHVDQRVTLVKLTEKGKSVKPDLEEISEKLLTRVYEGISEEEKDLVIDVLMRIHDNF